MKTAMISVDRNVRGGRISRRGFVKGLSAAVGVGVAGPVLAACGSVEADGARRVIVTQAVNSLAYAHNYIAQRMGFYAEQRLRVETVVTDGGGPDVQAVLADSAEFTINDGGQVVTALAGNRQLVAVTATFNRCLVNATISVDAARRLGIDESTPVSQRLAALRGLRIGVTAPGALTWQVARFNLANSGIDPDAATLVALGGGPAVLAALENDQVDVIYISVPFGEAAVGRGTGMTLIDHSRGEDPALTTFMMEGLWVTPRMIEENADVVRAMVTALKRASEFLVTADRVQVADVLGPDFATFDREVLLSAVDMLHAAASQDGRWGADAAATTTAVLTANGLLRAGAPAASDVFDDRFLG